MGMKRAFSVLFLFLLAGMSVSARDMMERPTAVVPGGPPRGFTILPVGYADASYVSHFIQSGDHDSFWISNSIHFGVVDLLNQRLGVYYSTYLFSGPVDDPSRQGSDLAPWLMNAVQYEYGLSWRYGPTGPVAGVFLPARLELVGDYGRRSFHPFRKGFSDPAADILRGGVALSAPLSAGGRVDTLLRLRWSRLFDFWGTDIPDPLATWSIQPALEYRSDGYSLAAAGRLGLFAVAAADILLVDAGSPEADLAGEFGVFLEPLSRENGPRQALEIYLNGYRSEDTEERPEGPYAATLLGLGVRFSVVW
jgi:hypothetical protein